MQALRRYLRQLQQEISLWPEAVNHAKVGRLNAAQSALEVLVADFSNEACIHNNLGWVYYQ